MMTKSGFFIFVLIVLTAMGFFVKLAIETIKEEQGTPEKREANMEQYVEKGLE
jgi:hypothetical protein